LLDRDDGTCDEVPLASATGGESLGTGGADERSNDPRRETEVEAGLAPRELF